MEIETDLGSKIPGFAIVGLPDNAVKGRLTRIAPKAVEKEGSTLFDVEVAIEDAGAATLRAGYSANADIIIQEKKDILVLPERLITFEKEKAFVELPPSEPNAEPAKKEVKVGLSDGLSTEILDGLAEGDEVVQRPPKQITGN